MADRESRDLAKFLERSPNGKPKRPPPQRQPYYPSNNKVWTPQASNSLNLTRLVLDNSERENHRPEAARVPLVHSPPSPGGGGGDHHPGAATCHPVYQEISYINGQINRMDLNQLKQACKANKLDSHGRREAVKRRLKEHLKREKLIGAGLIEPRDNRNVDFFVVIDFEATCEERNPAGYKHEIIEFPAVLVSSEEPSHIVDIFHSFVRPVINPELSLFCRTLTGIDQETVDKADPFPVVLKRFEDWLRVKHRLGVEPGERSFNIVTDGPFDMGRFFFLQLQHIGQEFPSYASRWANLRKTFANFYKGDFHSSSSTVKLPSLQTMLSSLDLEFQGKPHSGLDDSRNIARILIRLISDRAFIRVNERIVRPSPNDGPEVAYNARLKTVTSVNRKDAEAYFKKQKKKQGEAKKQEE